MQPRASGKPLTLSNGFVVSPKFLRPVARLPELLEPTGLQTALELPTG